MRRKERQTPESPNRGPRLPAGALTRIACIARAARSQLTLPREGKPSETPAKRAPAGELAELCLKLTPDLEVTLPHPPPVVLLAFH